MLRVGLSGGIGSGKSTVSRLLAQRGAMVVDADLIAREVLDPGTPGLAAVVERFGPGVRGADGALDRAALGAIVFADPAARADLEAITHPLIADTARARMDAAPAGTVVVHDVPLLVEGGLGPAYHLVLIVEAGLELRLARLHDRGVARADALARMSHQATDEERAAVADLIVTNHGGLADLADQVDRIWDGRLVPYNENLCAGIPVAEVSATALVGADLAWPRQAVRVVRRIRWCLERAGWGQHLRGIDHVGVTAVTGWATGAGPGTALDVQIRVSSLAEADAPGFAEAMRTAGYVCDEAGSDGPVAGLTNAGMTNAGMTDPPDDWSQRRYHGMDPGRVVRVSVRRHDSASSRTTLLLRDWSRHHLVADAAPGTPDRVMPDAETLDPRTLETGTLEPATLDPAILDRAMAWAESVGWRGPGPG